MKKPLAAGFLIFSLLIVQGCALSARRPAPDSKDSPPYILPTLLPTKTQTPIPSITPPWPTDPIDCSDNLSFLEDLSYPDGTPVDKGITIDKQWLVDNTGTCNWGEGYKMKLIAGEALGVNPEQSLVPVRTGSQAEIRIEFTAPSTAGTYRSEWQAFNPQGVPFGDSFYIEITVKGP